MKKVIKISEIQIIPTKAKNGLIGFVSYVLNDEFYIGAVAIFTRLDGTGIRLVYPQKNGIDCCHPIRRDIGEFITKKVSEKLNELFSNNQNLYEKDSKNPSGGDIESGSYDYSY